MIGKAQVDTPGFLYTNVVAELVSDDDVEMDVTIHNRQGVVLEVVHGTAWRYESGAWIVTTGPDDVAVITAQPGCGCGGSSVTPKFDGVAAGNGFLP